MTEALPLLQALMRGDTDASDESRIIDLLRAAPDDDLNALIGGVDVDALFSDVDDRAFGPDNRTVLLTLLGQERRDALTVANQARVIHALQTGRTDRAVEEVIADALCSRRGLELTALKNELNLRGDEHDLEGLVFLDVDSPDIRTRILDHFASEASALIREGQGRDVKVLSDIDDTAFSKLHEKRYPKGTLIPGVLALYQALDDGLGEVTMASDDLTFVTARPKDAFGFIETHTKGVLAKAGIARTSVLQGGFTNLVSKELMAKGKLANISRYLSLFPEYDLLWIGDSGQGDIITGLALLAEIPERTRLVIIHDVVATPAEDRETLRAQGVHVVDTYVAAGVIAHESGLVSDAGLASIVSATLDEFDQVEWESPEQEEATRALLASDLARVPAGLVTT
ncbi:MAG TPA: phosphatase domain-containing protein [Propionibacteriaceae bacterium]|nr:phosphatase domain-containing protein [Propionibacteriaceae bacterium]